MLCFVKVFHGQCTKEISHFIIEITGPYGPASTAPHLTIFSHKFKNLQEKSIKLLWSYLMIFVETSAIGWSRKYQLPMNERCCPSCGKKFSMNVPIAVKGYRGFSMELHSCDPKVYPRIYRPVDQKLKLAWSRALY